MYHEIRSERLSVKVNAARIRRAASWPGHGEWKSDRSKEMVIERVIEREREREREREIERERSGKGESDTARTVKREVVGA